MDVEYVPLLETQRDLYQMARGPERFQAYIKTLVDENGDMALPLSTMNPMGKNHLLPQLERYIELRADDAAAAATAEAAAHLNDVSGAFRVALVLTDDLMGGWTNRYAVEYSHRFESRPMLRRGWLNVLLWSSESPTLERVRDGVLSAIFRGAYIQAHRFATTLGEMIKQERFAMSLAAYNDLLFQDEEEITYTRTVIEPHLDADDLPTIMAALFGDEAARALGYTPLGLSPWAGLALAKAESGGDLA